ncbi:hypothetical protein AGG97_21430 [Klebsiella michiganensis]|nr:hypothetical protein AGG97_21430 [Klebsiella michiganensis]
MSSTTDKVNTKADQTALNALTGRLRKPRQASRQQQQHRQPDGGGECAECCRDDYIPNRHLIRRMTAWL